ncbi:hypothetical protein, partial [Ferrimonas futtsuensis]|uniref:hypothetical protein n=1 Tax=Ferrimonas futtsuensis TaxID=364764 RepID=UPI001B7FE643
TDSGPINTMMALLLFKPRIGLTYCPELVDHYIGPGNTALCLRAAICHPRVFFIGMPINRAV